METMPANDERPEDASFGRRLRELRRASGLTQRQLADQLKVDFTYLSKLENNRGEPPGEQTIRNLARVLKGNEEELLALAGKISPELREKAADDPEFALLLRRLPSLPPDVLERIYRNAAIRHGQARKPPSAK